MAGLKSALIGVLALAHAPLMATTLLDGGFETKGAALPVNSYCYDNVAAGDGLCVVSPWINLGSNTGVIKGGEPAWGGVNAYEGAYYGFIQVAGILAQSFTASATGTGSVSWFDHSRGGYGPLDYSVSLVNGMTSVALGTFSTQTSWTARTSSAFALTNGATYSLRFTGLASTDVTAFVDKVVLTSAAVPEPASWAMLLIGFGLVGAMARRRSVAIAA